MKALKNYLKNNKKTHLIFDFDATIFELILPWEKHFDAIEKELSALDQDLWSNYEQEITGDVVTQHKYIEQYGKKARDIFDKNSIWFEQHHLQNVRVNEPLVEFIQNDNDYVKYVWSSNSRPSIERVLKEHNLMDSFQAVVTREMVENIKPDLIIMDWHMPVMDGIQATMKIKNNFNTKDIPIIIANPY